MMNSSIYLEVKNMNDSELRMHILGDELPYEVKEVYLDELLSRERGHGWLRFDDSIS